ncbi:MAG: cell division protein FtsQ/DivIB [Bacilli bacterium]
MKKDSKLSFEEKLIIRKNKAKTVFIVKLACIVLVFCMVVLYFFAPISQVSNYKLEGNIYLSSSDVLEIAHLTKKTSLYSIDTKEVKELLDNHPLIDNSKVQCDFFGLKIQIDEIAPVCYHDGKYYLSNGEEVTDDMINNELYGSFLESNLEKTYKADFNPINLTFNQLNHFNQIWINASENVRQKIAFFDVEEGFWDCVYLYSGNDEYYYRVKFFDDFDSDISTFTELFSDEHVEVIYDVFESSIGKADFNQFIVEEEEKTELYNRNFYSIIVRYNQKEKTYSLDRDIVE